MSSFALKIIAGPELGREMLLLPGREMVIGRVEGADLVVVENNISRQHASVTATENTVQIRDLGSRNGTFLNGQRTTQATLKVGDEIVVGRCRLKIIISQPSVPVSTLSSVTLSMEAHLKKTRELTMPNPDPAVTPVAQTNPVTESGVCGSLAEIRLESMLRLLVRVYANPITESTDALLLEGLRQLDDLTHFGADAPSMDAIVMLAIPLPVRLAELEKQDMDFLQSVVDFKTVRRILDHFPGSNVEGYSFLQGMLARGILTVSPCPSHAETGETESLYSSSTAERHA
jgi:hypothetical protein